MARARELFAKSRQRVRMIRLDGPRVTGGPRPAARGGPAARRHRQGTGVLGGPRAHPGGRRRRYRVQHDVGARPATWRRPTIGELDWRASAKVLESVSQLPG
ncbi:MAG: hypothetical protein MZV63_16825 [Marinilabiliales bacterium]|nr:hypothetical protein [Marinilabiliales bacterium]